MRVVGVDGCQGGWIAVVYDVETGTLTPHFHPSFQKVLDAYSYAAAIAAAIAVDIPIGLREEPDPRACDTEARKLLKHRHPCVFPAPDPRVLSLPQLTYNEAKAESLCFTGKRISKQNFHMFPKLREVNQIVTPTMQGRVFEIHPEVSFWALAGGRPMDHPKDKTAGYLERRALLAGAFSVPIWSREEARSVARPATPDDVLDATVAAWTARRVAEGREGRLPANPEKDARGRRMEMVY